MIELNYGKGYMMSKVQNNIMDGVWIFTIFELDFAIGIERNNSHKAVG
jgi:hypothetical protein